jgi:hypothetical protein
MQTTEGMFEYAPSSLSLPLSPLPFAHPTTTINFFLAILSPTLSL